MSPHTGRVGESLFSPHTQGKLKKAWIFSMSPRTEWIKIVLFFNVLHTQCELKEILFFQCSQREGFFKIPTLGELKKLNFSKSSHTQWIISRKTVFPQCPQTQGKLKTAWLLWMSWNAGRVNECFLPSMSPKGKAFSNSNTGRVKLEFSMSS